MIWRTKGRGERAPRRGKPGPTRRTTGTPTQSGIEMTSRLATWVQLEFLPCSLCGRGWRLGGVAVQPALHVVVVELLAPEHPGGRLAQNRSFLRR